MEGVIGHDAVVEGVAAGFSQSATIFLNAMSSSSAKPCTHQTVAVVAAALAI
jgi:hypothetical protein